MRDNHRIRNRDQNGIDRDRHGGRDRHMDKGNRQGEIERQKQGRHNNRNWGKNSEKSMTKKEAMVAAVNNS